MLSSWKAEGEVATMHDMMNETMWGMGLGGLLLVALVVLMIAALIKYVFFR